MAKPLEILITAKLNQATSTTEIKKQLDKISKDVNLNLGIDSKGLDDITKKVDNLQKQVKSKLKGFKIIDADVAKQELNKVEGEFRKLYQSVDEAVNHYKQFGTVKVDTNLDPITKDIQSFNLQVEKGGALVEKLKFNLAQIAGSDQKVFEISKIGLTDKTDVLNEKQLQQEHQIRKKLQDDAEKQALQEAKVNQQLQEQIELYKKASSVQVANIERRYGDTLDVTKLNNYKEAIKKLSVDTPNVSHVMKDLNLDLRNISATAKTSTTHVLGMGEALRTAFQKFPVWLLVGTAIFAPIHALESGIKTIHELDDALTDLKKVTNETSDTYVTFAENVNKAADKIGASTSAYIASVTEFARLGQSLAQAKASAEQAVVYTNVGDFGNDSQTASKDLIATMKAYNLQFDEQGKSLQRIVDLYNNIGNKYAISSAGIGDAMRRSAASLSVAGNSIEQSVALITAANNSIQDPAQVGTALKTVSMRLRGVDEEGEKVDGLLPSLEKKFNSLGLSLEDSNGNFKSTYEIMNELANVFNSGKLNDLQKSDILELVAGKRQGNVVAGLLANIKDMNSALNDGMNSAGSSAKELDTYLNSLTAHVNQFKNSAVGFWQSSINTDDIKALVDAGTELLHVLTGLSHEFGLFPLTLGAVSAGLVTFNSRLRTSVLSIKTTDEELKAMSRSAKLAKLALSSTGIGLGFVVVGEIIQKVTGYFMKLHEEEQKAQEDQKKSIQGYQNNTSQIDSLITKYKDLSDARSKSKLNVDQEKEYYDVQSKLADLLPTLVAGTDAQGRNILISSKNIDENIKLLKQKIALERQESILNAPKKVATSNSNIQGFKDQVKEQEKLIDDLNKKIKDSDTLANNNANGSFAQLRAKEDSAKYTQQEKEAEGKILELKTKINTETEKQQSLFKDILNIYENLNGEDIDWISKLGSDGKRSAEQVDELGKAVNTVRKNLGDKVDSKFLQGFSDEQISVMATMLDKLNSGSLSANDFSSALQSAGISASDTKNILNALTVAQQTNSKTTGINTDLMQQFSDALQDTSKYAGFLQSLLTQGMGDPQQLEQLVNTYEILHAKQLALADGAKLSATEQAILDEVTRKLTSDYPGLIEGKNLNIKAAKNEVLANDVLRDAANKAGNGLLTAQQAMTVATVNSTNARISKMRDEIEAMKAFQLAFNKMVKDTERQIQMGTIDDAQLAQAYKIQMHMYQNLPTSSDLSAAEAKLNSLLTSRDTSVKKLADQIGYTDTTTIGGSKSTKTPKGSSSKTTADTQQVNKYATDAFSQSLSKLESQLKSVQATMNNYTDKTSKGYINALKSQIGLINQEESLTRKQIKTIESQNASLKRQRDRMGSFSRLSDDQKQEWNDLSKAIDDNVGKIDDLNGQLTSYGENVQDLQDQIKQVYSDTADSIIDIMKDMYDKEKQLALDANQKKMDLLDEEMKKYQDSVQQQIDAIDKQENGTSYLDDLATKQKDVADLQAQYDKLALDNSVEGKYRKEQLAKDLADKQKELIDFQHQHEVDVRKQNLQDDLDAKQKQVDNKKSELDKERDAINEYWDNVINDERKWTDVRNQILQGHFDQINATLKDFTKVLKDHMEDIGQSISQNLLDKIDDAEKKLNNLKGQSAPTSSHPPPPSGSGSSGGSSGGSSHSSSGSSSNSKSIGNAPLRKRSGGFATPHGNWDSHSVVDELKRHGYYATMTDREKLYDYFNGSGSYNGTQSQNDWLLKQLHIIGLRTGGYTADNEGLAYLHNYETVLNPHDSDNFLKAIELTRQMFIQRPNIPDFAQGNGSITINAPMEVHVTGDKKGAEDMLKIFTTQIGNEMHKKGRW